MRAIWTAAQATFALAGGVTCWFLGGFDGLIRVLVALVVIDYLTGLFRAAYNKRLSSVVGWKGIAKKVMTFVIVGVAHLIGYYILNDDGVIRSIVIFFYVSNEGLSLLENSASVGLPIPEKLKGLLIQLRNKGNGEDSNFRKDVEE